MDKSNEKSVEDESRRSFLKNSSYAVGGLVGGGILGSVFGTKILDKPTEHHAPNDAGYNEALMYFTKIEDFNILKEATERIFPKDDQGPGAIELLAPFYIDHQLAGVWGQNSKEYMQGPFFPGEPTQGYQTHLKRHQIFDIGLEALENYSQDTFKEAFVKIEDDQRDVILTAFQNDEVKLPGVSSSFFFGLLRSATLEGIYADPLYGGNKDMGGWKLKEYPGDQMSYLDQVDAKEFIKIDPSSLKDHHN